MLGTSEGRRRRINQRIVMDSITAATDMNLGKFQEIKGWESLSVSSHMCSLQVGRWLGDWAGKTLILFDFSTLGLLILGCIDSAFMKVFSCVSFNFSTLSVSLSDLNYTYGCPQISKTLFIFCFSHSSVWITSTDLFECCRFFIWCWIYSKFLFQLLLLSCKFLFGSYM